MVSIRQVARKDIKQRHLFNNSEMVRRHQKFFKILSQSTGIWFLYPHRKIRYKNTCLVSGSSHSVYSKGFRLSRHQIKFFFKHLTGLRWGSW